MFIPLLVLYNSNIMTVIIIEIAQIYKILLKKNASYDIILLIVLYCDNKNNCR